MNGLLSLLLVAVPCAELSASELPARVVLDAPNDGEAFFALEFPANGRLHVWAACSSGDPELSIATVDGLGQLVERQDDDGGGGTTAYLELDGERGQTLEVRVWVDALENPATVELQSSWALESETSLALAEGLRFDLAGLSLDAAEAPIHTEELARNLPTELTLMSPAILGVAEQFAALPRRARTHEVELVVRELLHTYAEAHLPPHHDHRLQAAARFAIALKENHRTAEARELETAILRAFLEVLSPDDRRVQFARMNLAGSHFLLDELDRAVIEFRTLLSSAERSTPPDPALLSMTRQNLAAAELELGYADRAAETYAAEIEALSRAAEVDELALAALRANYCRALIELGRPDRAEAILASTLPVMRAGLAPLDPLLVACELAHGSALAQLGDPQAARLLYERVLAGQLASHEATHPDVLVTRRLLAEVLFQLHDFEGARSLYQEIVAAHAELDHRPTLESLLARLHLAETQRELGELERALAGFEGVIADLPEGLSSTHPLRIAAHVDLAAALTVDGDLERARPIQESVLSRLLTVLPETDPDVQRARHNLAWTLVREGRHDETVDLLSTSTRALRDRVRRVGSERSAREIEGIVERSRRDLDEAVSIAACLPEGGPRSALEDELFELVESVRSIGLAHRRVQRRVGPLDAVPAIREARAALAAAEAEVVRRSRTGTEEFFSAIVQRDSAEAALQTALIERDSSLRVEPTEARALAERLRPREAAVGFWRYERKQVDPETLRLSAAAPHYLAYVVRPTGVQRIELGPAGVIDAAIDRWRDAVLGREARAAGAHAADRGVALAGQPLATGPTEREAGSELRARIVDPLREALGDAVEIRCAPDDALFLVPFDALPEADESSQESTGGVLGDSFQFTYRTSFQPGAPLLDAPAPVLLAMGGVDYDSVAPSGNEPPSARPSAPAARPAEEVPPRLRHWRAEFDYLPGSAREVDALGRVFERTHPGAESFVLTGARADRETFETLGARATYLHLATHAYVAPESIPSTRDTARRSSSSSFDQREQVRGFAPMLLCGLAFAGANTAAPGTALPNRFTAQEIASLDLSRCRLAVLSACDTNLGVRRAGQGVASLQNALHAAGVRTSIASLWKVPDEATQQLMTSFYSALWEEELSPARALWRAKNELRRSRDDQGLPRHATRDWAAWVLVGEP